MDVDFEGLLFVSGSPDTPLRGLKRVWVQKEEETTLFACFGGFPLKLFDIERVAKLALKDGRLELVTKSQVLKFMSFLSRQAVVLLVGAEGNQSRWRKVSVGVWF